MSESVAEQEAAGFDWAAHRGALQAREADPVWRKAWGDWVAAWGRPIAAPAAARVLVTVPTSVRPLMNVLWVFAEFSARGLMTREACCDDVVERVFAKAVAAAPGYPRQRAEVGVHQAFDRYVQRITDDIIGAQERIRWKVRGMLKGPMPPTREDPEGRRQPTSGELLAAAMAIGRDSGVLWMPPERGLDEVTPVVEDEVLAFMQRRRRR